MIKKIIGFSIMDSSVILFLAACALIAIRSHGRTLVATPMRQDSIRCS